MLEQLRRATDTGQRIFDFVRQHCRQRDHRTCGATVRQLTVHFVGDAALLQHHDDMARPLGKWRDVKINLTVTANSRRSQVNLILVHWRAARTHLIDQCQQRTAKRD